MSVYVKIDSVYANTYKENMFCSVCHVHLLATESCLSRENSQCSFYVLQF